MSEFADPLDPFASEVVVDNEVPPEILANPNAVVVAAAEDAAKTLPTKSKRLTVELQAFVRRRMESTDYTLPLPPYDAILHEKQYWAVLEDCLRIVEVYRKTGYDQNSAGAANDLMRLWGNLAHLGGVVGYLSASVDHADSARKMAKSKAYMATKEARDELGMHVTDSDATEMSRLSTEAYDKNKQYLSLMAQTIRGSFYAIRHFAEELGRITNRNVRTETQGAKHA